MSVELLTIDNIGQLQIWNCQRQVEMSYWMQAWAECAGTVEPVTRAPAGTNEAIPVDMRSQITTLLASMIPSLQQEAVP